MAEKKENNLGLQNPESDVIGPFLRFGNYSPSTFLYSASVMIVVHPRVNIEGLELTYGPENGSTTNSEPKLLDTHMGYRFMRFELQLALTDQAQKIRYTVHLPTAGTPPGTEYFAVPSKSEPWHWMFYSCNGYHGEYKAEKLRGIQPLWRDFFNEHVAKPFHVQFGTGDQIYNDPLWDGITNGNCPALLDWRKCWVKGDKSRVTDPFTPEMRSQVEGFYFMHYCRHFSQALYSKALATVPYVFTWDDHDIFDGWGSYPPFLQTCEVFQSIFGIAKRFYLLFQQQTTAEKSAFMNWTWGGAGGFNEIKILGSSVAVWMLDNRSERSRERIAAEKTYEMAREKLINELPPGIRHVVVVTTVPIVWPKIPLTEEFMASMSGDKKKGIVWTLMNKTGLAQSMLSNFHEPNLLDDLLDHWTADGHQAEKKQMIELMQDVARKHKVRVSFISGDVHCAAVGRLYSYPKQQDEDFREDFRFMANITSSAMGNEAPPDALMKIYESTNFAGDLTHLKLQNTREKMVKRFRGGKYKFYNRRNYCTVEEEPYDPNRTDIKNGQLNFTLRAEHPKELDKVDIWENFIPILTTTVDKWAKA